MEELSNYPILTYDSTLDILTLYGFKGGFTRSADGLYYFRKETPRLQGLTGLYLKLQPQHLYYSTNQGLKWVVYSVDNLQAIEHKAVIFASFKIIGSYYSLEKLKSKSKLKGFSRVIDDNEYFSKIPIINQITHYDNGILYASDYMVASVYDQERQVYPIHFPDHVKVLDLQKNWDTFKLEISVDELENPVLKMTGGEGHHHL